MSRKLLFLAIATVLTLWSTGDIVAQSRRPIGRLGQALGLGWGYGNHWRSPAIQSDYYVPYSEHNTARYFHTYQDDPRSETPAEYLRSPEPRGEQPTQIDPQTRWAPIEKTILGQPYNSKSQLHSPIFQRPISYSQNEQELDLPNSNRQPNPNRLRRYQPRYPDF